MKTWIDTEHTVARTSKHARAGSASSAHAASSDTPKPAHSAQHRRTRAKSKSELTSQLSEALPELDVEEVAENAGTPVITFDDVTMVYCSNEDHDWISRLAYENGVFSWAMGEFDELSKEEYTLVPLYL